MDRTQAIIIAAAVIGAGVMLARYQWTMAEMDTAQAPENTTSPGIIEETMSTIRNTLRIWWPPAQYAQAIAAAEAANGIPSNMLARLLWQESRYREDIITGKVKSPAGALGIAQFMPATAREMGIDPLDPFQAIPAAAKYLARLKRSVGTWSEALAAYNWGIGNVTRKGIAAAPAETRSYYTSILLDVNTANGTELA